VGAGGIDLGVGNIIAAAIAAAVIVTTTMMITKMTIPTMFRAEGNPKPYFLCV
jgi:predicted ABC-type sugar transport system permease subunit